MIEVHLKNSSDLFLLSNNRLFYALAVAGYTQGQPFWLDQSFIGLRLFGGFLLSLFYRCLLLSDLFLLRAVGLLDLFVVWGRTLDIILTSMRKLFFFLSGLFHANSYLYGQCCLCQIISGRTWLILLSCKGMIEIMNDVGIIRLGLIALWGRFIKVWMNGITLLKGRREALLIFIEVIILIVHFKL